MKKIMNSTLIAVVLSVALVGSVNARYLGGIKTDGVASPTNVEAFAKKMEKVIVDPKASETKVMTQMDRVVGDVSMMRQKLANLRNWTGDLRGYAIEEIQAAMEAAEGLIAEVCILRKKIALNESEVAKISTKRLFGLAGSSVTEDNKAEHTRLIGEIATAKKRLAELEPSLGQLEIIMGRRRSNAVRAGYGAILTAVGSVAIDQLVFEGKYSNQAKDAMRRAYAAVAQWSNDAIARFEPYTNRISAYVGSVGAAIKGYFGYGEEEQAMPGESSYANAAALGIGTGAAIVGTKGRELGRRAQRAARGAYNQYNTNRVLRDLEKNPGNLGNLAN